MYPFLSLPSARERREGTLSTLIDFCRVCKDPFCPDSCEVKKAYYSIVGEPTR